MRIKDRKEKCLAHKRCLVKGSVSYHHWDSQPLDLSGKHPWFSRALLIPKTEHFNAASKCPCDRQDGYFSSLTSSRCLAMSIKSHSVLPWQTSFLFSGRGSIMWYLACTIKMENVCWGDNRVIDMYWAINYVKQNGATSLTKTLSGARLALLQSRLWLPRAAFGKALDAARGAFHLKCCWLSRLFDTSQDLLGISSFPPLLNSAPNEYFLIHLQHLSQPWTLWRGSPLISCPVPSKMAFGLPALFILGILGSILCSCLHFSPPLQFGAHLTPNLQVLSAISASWWLIPFSQVLTWTSLCSFLVCRWLSSLSYQPVPIHVSLPHSGSRDISAIRHLNQLPFQDFFLITIIHHYGLPRWHTG